MRASHRILLVDDDQDLLDLYQEILSQLPSRPEIATAISGPRAIAMLEAEPFTMLVCDLNMPKMDGLQVLSIVRRKYPDLRTVVLTSVVDEQFRSRVYAVGVDLYWQKPGSGDEIKQFLDCIESLLGRRDQSGFRGVQSKSLVDIVQLECISKNSTMLKITNGPLVGKIWIHDGEVIDASVEDLLGEPAFQRILSWKSGSFESLPSEPEHPRNIYNSYQGLLLETAQAHDEATGAREAAAANGHGGPAGPDARLEPLSKVDGVEFVLALKPGTHKEKDKEKDKEKRFDALGLENPEPMAEWSRHTIELFSSLGERLQAGPFADLIGLGPKRNLVVARHQDVDFCVGWQRELATDDIRESMRKVLALWVS